MKTGLKGLMLTTALVALTALPAFAQDPENPFLRGRYTAVTERDQPEFDPEPMHVSTFDVMASVGLSAAYNDNIFATPNNEVSDTILRAQPAVEARSNWSVHEVSGGVSVDHKEYLDNGSESATDYDAFANGRLDVSRNFAMSVGGNLGHRTEERYENATTVLITDRAAYDYTGAFLRGLYRMDRFQIEGTVGITDDSYDQAAQALFRDNTETYVNARVSYAISPDLAVFVQGRRSDLDFTDNTRDGTRTSVDAGVNFELAAPFRGEIAVGSFEDDRDGAADKTTGLNVAANVQWFPTQLTTVTFSANRGVADSGIATAASSVNTGYGVRVDHELLRNVLLFARIRQDKNEYQGIDRDDDALSAGIGAAWKLNKNARVEAEYSARSQDSSGVNAGPSLDQNVISVGLRLFP